MKITTQENEFGAVLISEIEFNENRLGANEVEYACGVDGEIIYPVAFLNSFMSAQLINVIFLDGSTNGVVNSIDTVVNKTVVKILLND